MSSVSGCSGPSWPVVRCRRRPTIWATRPPRSASSSPPSSARPGWCSSRRPAAGSRPTADRQGPRRRERGADGQPQPAGRGRRPPPRGPVRQPRRSARSPRPRSSGCPHVAKGLQPEFPELVLELSLDELGRRARPARPAATSTSPPRTPTMDGIERPGHSRHVLTEEGYCVVAPRGHELLERVGQPGPDGALAGQADDRQRLPRQRLHPDHPQRLPCRRVRAALRRAVRGPPHRARVRRGPASG